MEPHANLQLPFYQQFDIVKIHLALGLLQVKRVHRIYIAVLVQLRKRLLSIFGYCARMLFVQISSTGLSDSTPVKYIRRVTECAGS